MTTNKEQVRNQEGRLLCEVIFRGAQWIVCIKNHGIYTELQLEPDGRLIVTDHESSQ